eukprot:gb/GECG01012308.1/.p1 GENE.gb/GECG01012308.1/~~gb/GECG01012308.1/.p1  ORF type:complete len:131 (+),score=22.23 gb/GECG01012308.1/:1-393(+)
MMKISKKPMKRIGYARYVVGAPPVRNDTLLWSPLLIVQSVIERTEKRLKEVAESIARIKYVDDSGYWTNETFSTPNKRPPEYSAEMAGNISNNVTLPSSITQAAESNPGESKDNDRSDDKEETKDGSLEL